MSTGARRDYPKFKDLTMDDWTELLRISKLSPRQKEVATQCVIWKDMALPDIAAIHGVDRRTISRWMESDILPELEGMLAYMHKQVV